jgi:hypothetical protein
LLKADRLLDVGTCALGREFVHQALRT